MYPGIGGVPGKLWRKTSSFDLKIVKVLRDLMFGGTTLYSADTFEVNELNLMVFTLLYLELPSGLRHVVPCLVVSRKLMLTLFGILRLF